MGSAAGRHQRAPAGGFLRNVAAILLLLEHTLPELGGAAGRLGDALAGGDGCSAAGAVVGAACCPSVLPVLRLAHGLAVKQVWSYGLQLEQPLHAHPRCLSPAFNTCCLCSPTHPHPTTGGGAAAPELSRARGRHPLAHCGHGQPVGGGGAGQSAGRCGGVQVGSGWLLWYRVRVQALAVRCSTAG